MSEPILSDEQLQRLAKEWRDAYGKHETVYFIPTPAGGTVVINQDGLDKVKRFAEKDGVIKGVMRGGDLHITKTDVPPEIAPE